MLGFHGCDKSTGLDLLEGRQRHLKPSTNSYDWLGGGIYFWEADPWRAHDFAVSCTVNEHLTKGKVKDPYVVGAVIDLGHCLNLFEFNALAEVKSAHEFLEEVYKVLGDQPMPKNGGHQLGKRNLDKAVLDTVHLLRERRRFPAYTSVRSPFIEGDSLYHEAGFRTKNHIQIAVRDSACIRGYFRLSGL